VLWCRRLIQSSFTSSSLPRSLFSILCIVPSYPSGQCSQSVQSICLGTPVATLSAQPRSVSSPFNGHAEVPGSWTIDFWTIDRRTAESMPIYCASASYRSTFSFISMGNGISRKSYSPFVVAFTKRTTQSILALAFLVALTECAVPVPRRY
jgi:hypothetical protein